MTFQQDTDETPVIFRKMLKRAGGEVIAIFPTDASDMDYYLCGCYVHVGQHGSCHPHYVINNSKAAKPEEYADLKAELEGAPYGYRFRVYRKLQRKWLDVRRKEIQRIREAA